MQYFSQLLPVYKKKLENAYRDENVETSKKFYCGSPATSIPRYTSECLIIPHVCVVIDLEKSNFEIKSLQLYEVYYILHERKHEIRGKWKILHVKVVFFDIVLII